MVGLAGLLAVAAAASPVSGADGVSLSLGGLLSSGAPRLVAAGGLGLRTTEPVDGTDAARPAGCAVDACPPEPGFPGGHGGSAAVRPSRAEILTRLLERTTVEPFATAGSLLRFVPLRVQWSPPIDGSAAIRSGRSWLGSLVVSLRWYIDPNGGPMPRRGGP